MRYGVLCCQTILLVLPPIPVKVPLIGEPIGAAWVPPLYCFPSTYLVSYREKALVRIVPETWKLPVSGLYDIGAQLVPPIPEGWISTGSSQKGSKMQPAFS